MQRNLVAINLISLFLLSGAGYGQEKKNFVNYLGIKGPITIQKIAYQLAWSAHPDASLYKQEYLAAGDGFPTYKSMVTVDFVVTEATVDQAVNAKLRELETLKRTYPIVQAEVFNNAATGEKMIDCLIGNTGSNQQTNLIERDVYRYKLVEAKSGQRGILLLAVSIRKYGNDITPFLTRLKSDKPLLVNEVAKLPMPEISVNK
ncbi:hypothetical protein GCM10027341_47860 [Spirosoma knui]